MTDTDTQRVRHNDGSRSAPCAGYLPSIPTAEASGDGVASQRSSGREDNTRTLNVISLGAGLQSSAMALKAAHGEITPMPDAAIFADTQNEPQAVYLWLRELEDILPFPVMTVTRGDLKRESLRQRRNKKTGKLYYSTFIPAFVRSGNSRGILQRKCTYDFKVIPIVREAKRMMKERGANDVVQWIGISLDEAHRMKPSKERAISHRWPLVEQRLSRWDCERWMTEHGYRVPPKSACVFCPFHSDRYWRELQARSYPEWVEAVEYERDFQDVCKNGGARETPFLHSSLKPLDEVDFSTDEDRGQQVMFGNECEGLCGV